MTPSPNVASARPTLTPRARLVGVTAGALLAGALVYALLSSPELLWLLLGELMGRLSDVGTLQVWLIITATALLGVGVPLALGGVVAAWALSRHRLADRDRDPDLVGAERLVNGLGIPYAVVGRVHDHAVRAYRDRFVVQTETGEPVRFDRAALRGLARDDGPAAEAARTLRGRGVKRVEVGDGEVVVHGLDDGTLSAVVRAALDLAASQRRLVRVAPRLGAAADGAPGKGCPYCHEELASVHEAPLVRCPACDVQQHAECWRDHGGCAVWRCRRAPPPAVEARRAEAVEVPAQVAPAEPPRIRVSARS